MNLFTTDTRELDIIGRAERADFAALHARHVPVKIDTGADYCSIWASKTEIDDEDVLHVVFFGKGSKFYTGQSHEFLPHEYSLTRVANSFGGREVRYKIKLTIKVAGRLIKSSFTLADRSHKLYPVLIGRSLLKGKFLVDVQRGRPLIAAERKRAHELKHELKIIKKENGGRIATTSEREERE